MTSSPCSTPKAMPHHIPHAPGPEIRAVSFKAEMEAVPVQMIIEGTAVSPLC